MHSIHPPLAIPDATAMTGLAQRLAPHLRAGDVLLLEGPIGAGKSHFARALIQHLLERSEDVPSPTFTLVQTYDAPGFEIWHADLYRLSHPDEAFELGLTDAFDTALCLVEWPEKLGADRPETALTMRFDVEVDDSRSLAFLSPDESWRARLKGLADV
ncbi:MAG TPA: tRNA (adenosine(37)-N6)-threonylcarbamoyltransferase complex ATPase subunit type 1 TsaE [Paracoccus sp.]|nr:tRNA (adenosine(37)-N6)-threonylcarbamoyltransferase complex ATPase subunit type 1 TsaE [Paracoccus sp. (in: a-proteobacteria)]